MKFHKTNIKFDENIRFCGKTHKLCTGFAASWNSRQYLVHFIYLLNWYIAHLAGGDMVPLQEFPL